MKHDESVKFKFDKLTIGPYDLVLGEGTPRMLMLHLYYLLITNNFIISTKMVLVFQYVPLTNPSLL